MRIIITILISLICFSAAAQLPNSLPYPYAKGFSRNGYYMADSSTIIGLRDTGWSARYIGSMVFYRTVTDTSLYIWNGVRWMGVAGTATPINPANFIQNQYLGQQVARAWFDTCKVLKVFSDSIKIGTLRYNVNAALSIGSTAGVSGIAIFSNPYKESSYVNAHWYDTTTFEISAIGVPSPNGKTLSLSANQVQALAYNVNLTAANKTTVTNFYGTNPVTVISNILYEGFTNSGGNLTFNQRPAQSGSNFYDGGTLTVTGQGATTGGTDKNGGNVVISAGISTGNGSSTISFKTAAAGSTGTTDRTPATRMTVKGSGIINIATISTYANNAAALSGGLVAGDLYMTATGVVMIVF